jgi:hypothetical protein
MNTCNKTSNNKYFNCPARMEDGRSFTDYRPSSDVDDMIRYSNNIIGNYEYRQFLINNATKIMNVNNQYTTEKMSCTDCNAKPIPFTTVCEVDRQISKCKVTNPRGVGLDNIGYFYKN